MTSVETKNRTARQYDQVETRDRGVPKRVWEKVFNKEAWTLEKNRDGEMLRLQERLLLAFCRPVKAPPLSVATTNYTLDNALEYSKRMIPDFPLRLKGKSVLDYGCGPGWQTVAMRQAGARSVFGLDINHEWLNHGRSLAKSAGVDAVSFGKNPDCGTYDVVISLNSIEHFRDPEREVARMCSMATEEVLISFAEPWYSPYGTHLGGTTRLPWLNLIFSERTLMNVRNLYPDGTDGARRFVDVRGGLNGMTVARFERMMAAAPAMKVMYIAGRAVKGLPIVEKVPVVRELMTGAITCVLQRK
jgi:2-polyprenyl-3-methyl-5-hydroxy-6-metoxy-1,4-benzoquinol methylase